MLSQEILKQFNLKVIGDDLYHCELGDLTERQVLGAIASFGG